MNAAALPADHRLVPERHADPARPGRERHRQRGEHVQRGLVLLEGQQGNPISQRAITLQVMRQPGTNTIEVTDRVRALLPTFESELPPSAHLSVRQDRSKTIRQAFKDIQVTMLVTLVLVVGVIFVFLHNGSATLIPALALPFSILGTFAVMQLLGFSLNNLSMMALILSVGFVVDDAIVMLENIVRHMEHGESAFEASLRGSSEIGFTILTMTTSLAAVFIPILFMTGVLGRLFREFAVTITAAILISGVVSVTLTPMLCSRFLRVASLHAKTGLAGILERAFGRLQRGYERSLAAVLRHRPVMLALFVVVLVATVQMYRIIPTGFIPDQDNDSLGLSLRAAQGTSFYDMAKWTQQISDIVIKNPYVESFLGFVNGGSTNNSRIMIQLVPRATRPLTAAQIAQQIRADTGRFAGFRSFVTLPPALQIGGRMGNQNYSLMMQSLDHDELYAWAGKVEQAISEQVGEVQDVSTDMEMKSPRVDLSINRDSAAAVGLNATQIENTLSTGFGSTWASTIYGPASQYRVLLELDPKYQLSANSLKNIAFKGSNGAMVPLDSVVSYKESVGPQSINHSGQLPSVSVSFGLKPGVSLGQALAHVKQVADAMLPPTVTTTPEGSARVFEQSMSNLGLLLFVAIGVVYIVLGALYESYIHPITILSGLPSAGLGALITLVSLRQRAEHLLVRRPDPAHRHREEERDHADRLRARGRAQAQQDAGRRDLRRLPHPLPSDHDDDDGGAARRGADRARLRVGRRSAAAARPGRRRRPDGVAAHHALSHAGRVHLSRRGSSRRGAFPIWRRPRHGAFRRTKTTHEHF